MEPITLLNGKKIILGVTGSIAVYKAVDLASRLTQAGALVDVIMSEAAGRFVQVGESGFHSTSRMGGNPL